MYLYDNNMVFFILVLEVCITSIFLVLQNIGYSKLIKTSSAVGNNDLELKNIINSIMSYGNNNNESELNSIEKHNIVNSVDNYVNNYVSNYEFCGLKLYTINRICGQLLNFVFITWSIVSVYGVYLECSIKEILWTIMLGILIVGGLFSFGYTVDNFKLEKIAKVNLRCYIDRLAQTNRLKREAIIYTDNRQQMVDFDNTANNNYNKYSNDINEDNLGYLNEYYNKRGSNADSYFGTYYDEKNTSYNDRETRQDIFQNNYQNNNKTIDSEDNKLQEMLKQYFA